MQARVWRARFVLLLAVTALLLAVACTAAAPPAPTPTTSPPPTPTPEWVRAGWDLVWQDEFNGPELDRNNWTPEIGGTGWGNNELQFYTDRPENVRIEDGQLVIEARDEFFIPRNYTSARLKTEGLHAFQYGRIEARIQIPRGQGIWPAFWMLGNTAGNWPHIGEIDIMENIGSEPNIVHGTVHGPNYSGGEGVGASAIDPGAAYADDFRIYAVEWEAEQIRWYVDDRNYFTLEPDGVPGDWVFDDHPFYLLLNVAVGGRWPGSPDETTQFPQQMRVDYVRVYRPAAAEP